MQESEIARSRDHSQDAENKRRQLKNAKNVNIKMKNVKMKMKNVEMFNRREQAFQDSTARELSQFERVEMKMTTIHDEMIDSEIEHAVHRADSVSDRKRGRERERRRERKRRREQRERRERREQREREQAVSK